MPQVSVYFKMYIPGGHHRQPRNAGAMIDLSPPSTFLATSPSNFIPSYFDILHYSYGGGSGDAELMFWSVTDGTNGRVYPAGTLTQPVGALPLTITAWYRPISGPANGGNGGSSIIDDAFSAVQGSFIDDTFVNVTSDPSLTSNANVVGVVPTKVAETLDASGTVASTTEPFNQWIAVDAGVASGATLKVPAGANGIAIAVYQLADASVHRPRQYEIGGIVIGGIPVDGPGVIIIGGVPHPVGPWGPLIVRLVRNSTIALEATSMEKKIGAQVRRLSAQDSLVAIKHALPELEREAGE
jgi:hypothetical protein